MSFYATKKFNSLEELRGILNGPAVDGASGNLATTAVGSPNISVPAAAGGEGDFTNVQTGDRILVTGELFSTIFLVVTKVDDQHLVLDNNFTALRAGTGVWYALRHAARIPLAKIQFGGPVHGPTESQGFVIYDAS
jgi:hypothetical protein